MISCFLNTLGLYKTCESPGQSPWCIINFQVSHILYHFHHNPLGTLISLRIKTEALFVFYKLHDDLSPWFYPCLLCSNYVGLLDNPKHKKHRPGLALLLLMFPLECYFFKYLQGLSHHFFLLKCHLIRKASGHCVKISPLLSLSNFLPWHMFSILIYHHETYIYVCVFVYWFMIFSSL